MKTLLFTLGLLFTLNAHSQDTTYFIKRHTLYRSITASLSDSSSKHKVMKFELERHKRMDRFMAITTATIFTSLTVWYFKIIK
jgi:hypothetical protein